VQGGGAPILNLLEDSFGRQSPGGMGAPASAAQLASGQTSQLDVVFALGSLNLLGVVDKGINVHNLATQGVLPGGRLG
jgi:hypothetical protein